MMSHLAFYILSHPDFLQETLHGSEVQRDVKNMCYDLSRPKHTENTDTVMPDRGAFASRISTALSLSELPNESED